LRNGLFSQPIHISFANIEAFSKVGGDRKIAEGAMTQIVAAELSPGVLSTPPTDLL
jgi:hypothetical protein